MKLLGGLMGGVGGVVGTLGLLLTSAEGADTSRLNQATALLFPSRLSGCDGPKAGWNLIKMASVLLDEDAQNKGVSSALDGQTWSMINGLPLTTEATPWQGECPSLDEFIENLLHRLLSFDASADAIVAYIEGHVRFLDAERLGLTYGPLARRFAGAALVLPSALIVPSCVASPHAILSLASGAAGTGTAGTGSADSGTASNRHLRAVEGAMEGAFEGMGIDKMVDIEGYASEFGSLFEKVTGVLGNRHGCLSCLRKLILDVGELVTGLPLDPAIAETVLSVFKSVEGKLHDALKELMESGNLTNPAELLHALLPGVIDTVKDSVGDGKEEAVMEFLETVRDEMKTSGTAPIENRIQQFFHSIGC